MALPSRDIRPEFKTKHAYELTVRTADGKSELWSVWANNRTQAGSLAKRNGASEVCDCNMVG